MSGARFWPTPQDYNLAIQNPRHNLGDPELRAGTVAVNKLGLPLAISGAFASVYRISSGSRDWAVRCFYSNRADTGERYDAIAGHLRRVPLPYTVPFEYLPEGIKVNGAWHPILKMEWIQGRQLDEYIRDRLGDATALRQLATRWLEMSHALEASGIAHGDLQHGNVIVVGDELRLVDYDGMVVPKLYGRPSHELGHRNYQHPGRTERDVGPALDRFAVWVVYASLLGVAADPNLWHAANAGDDCLLFRHTDFDDPASSPVFAALEGSTDQRVRTAAGALRLALGLAPLQTPVVRLSLPSATDRHRPNSTDAGGAAWLAVPCLLGRPVGLPISFGGAPPLQSLSCNENSRGAGEVDDGAWYRDHVAPAVPWHTFERPPHLARASLALSMVALAASIVLTLPTVALVPLPVIGLVLAILIPIDTAILASSYFRDPAVLRKRLLCRQRRLQLRRTRESQWRIRQLDGSMASVRRKDERRRQKLVARRAAILTRERAERQAVEADLQTNLDLLDARLRDLDAILRDELAVAVGASGPMVDTLREAIVTKHVAQRKRLAERRTKHEGKAEARRQAIDNRYATRYAGLDSRLAEEDGRLQEHLTALETPLAEARLELREARETIDLTAQQLHAYGSITPRGYARFIVWQPP